MLRATTACTFSTSRHPKVLRPWCALYILTWKCASRHNGVHFFRHLNFQSGPRPPVFYTSYFETCFAPQRRATFHLSSAPAALASLLFDPPESQTIGKTQCFATLLPFRVPESSFFSLFLFSDLLSSALLFSDSSSVHIVGSLTSKHLFDHIWSRFSCVTTSLLPFVFLHFCLMWRCDFPDSEHVQN